MEQWSKDGDLNVKEGQMISPEVFWQLCEALPPHRWSNGILQPGEAYTHEPQTGRPMYQTFKQYWEDYYEYIGLRP